MRKTCLEQIYLHAKQDDRIVFVGSDLGAGTLSVFREEIPDRFFMEGIAEGHTVGMASGLAYEGKIVYVNTIQTFLTRRCYEQIFVDACLHNLNVRFVGNGGGFVYAPLGPTHWAIEDLAILRVIPNMTVLCPADAWEMEQIIPATIAHQGPVFIRLAKGGDPIVTDYNRYKFKIGKAYSYAEGKDVLLIGCGIMLDIMKKASKILAGQNIHASILHVPSIKPLDKQTILEVASEVPCVLTLEEHSVLGGLGGAVAEVLAESGMSRPLKFKRLGQPDLFEHHYGSQQEHLAHLGLDPEGVAATAKEMLNC